MIAAQGKTQGPRLAFSSDAGAEILGPDSKQVETMPTRHLHRSYIAMQFSVSWVKSDLVAVEPQHRQPLVVVGSDPDAVGAKV